MHMEASAPAPAKLNMDRSVTVPAIISKSIPDPTLLLKNLTWLIIKYSLRAAAGEWKQKLRTQDTVGAHDGKKL